MTLSRLAVMIGCSRSHAERLAHATAEFAIQKQHHVLSHLCRYLALQKEAGEMRPLAFYFHTSYDETLSRVRVAWKVGQRPESQLAKIYTVKNCWAMLVRLSRAMPAEDMRHPLECGQHLILRGACSPAMAGSDGTTGEAVASVVSHTYDFPENLQQTFDVCIRVTETDGARSNARGERLWAGANPGWTKVHIGCTAHVVHSAMIKTFSLLPAEVTSGITRLFLSVQGSTQIASLRRLAAQLAFARARVEGPRPLSREAAAFRDMALRHFLPAGRCARKHLKVVVSAALVFNFRLGSPKSLGTPLPWKAMLLLA